MIFPADRFRGYKRPGGKMKLRFVLYFSMIVFLASCAGGGGKGTQVSGDFCVNDNNTYTINDGSGSRTYEIGQDRFLAYFLANIGGQIRAVSDITIKMEGFDPFTALIWGSGSTIRGGTAETMLASVPLRNEGVITSLTRFGDASSPKIFYGSARGVGILKRSETSEGSGFEEEIFKTIPSGVISASSSTNGSSTNFFLTTGTGYVISATDGSLASGGNCYGIIASPSTLTEQNVTFIPVKTAAASSKVFVLGKESIAGGLSPDFSQAFGPVLKSMAIDAPTFIVKVVDTGSKTMEPVAFPLSTKGFTGFDRFIPTDVATDGTRLYVAGLGYEKAALDSFIATYCDEPSLEERISCLEEKAKSGVLIKHKNESGLDALTGGFFIYRDLTKVNENADYFARVPLPLFFGDENSPPLIFNVAVKEDKALLRSPNFLATLEKTVNDITGEERWVITNDFDAMDGLFPGLPTSVNMYSMDGKNYAVATVVGLKTDQGSGVSTLETVSPEGALSLLDMGAVETRLEDGAGSYVALVEPFDEKGGMLYLANITDRKWISPSSDAGAYVSRAAYDGTNLAFTWSRNMLGWTLSWQEKDRGTTKGDYNMPISGDSRYFVGFPDVGSAEVETLKETRTIADLSFADKKLFALLYGFYEGKHYYQAAVYTSTLTDSKYTPVLAGFTNTISITGEDADRRARFQKITKNSDGSFTAMFSCAGGLRKFTITPSSPPPPARSIDTVFSTANVIDLDINDTGDLFAFLSGKSIRIRNLSDPATNISSTSVPQTDDSTKLKNASLVLHSKWMFLSTPEGATSPFWVINISQPTIPTQTMKCNACKFNGLAWLPSFENNLLASSDTGGVEIYDISNLE